MMRRPRKVSLLVAVSLLGWAATAHADCGWVVVWGTDCLRYVTSADSFTNMLCWWLQTTMNSLA